MRLIPGRLLALVLTLLAGLVAAIAAAVVVPPAQAAGPASVSLVGRGFGHGHGMSQYGAQNAAKNHGRSASQILNFYYPGTKPASATGAMAVLISADTSTDVVVAARSGLTVRSLKTGTVYKLSRAGATRWKIDAVPGNKETRISVFINGAWHVRRDIPGEAEFRAGGQAMRLYLPNGSVSYRGRLRSAIPDSGTGRDTVNIVDIEDYLKGVVPVEVPASWAPQAVQAQAVAARTYAAFGRANPHPGHYHLCDTTACQVYRGVDAEHPDSNKAVAATKSRIRAYDGKAAFTQFSSSNGGWSSKGSRAYLVAREDPYDLWSGNPNARWEVDVKATTIENAWPSIGDFQVLRVVRRDGNGSWGGRVTEMRIRGSEGAVTVSGDAFRSTVGIKSTMFVCAGAAASCPG